MVWLWFCLLRQVRDVGQGNTVGAGGSNLLSDVSPTGALAPFSFPLWGYSQLVSRPDACSSWLVITPYNISGAMPTFSLFLLYMVEWQWRQFWGQQHDLGTCRGPAN
jgi:hypothetical protein